MNKASWLKNGGLMVVGCLTLAGWLAAVAKTPNGNWKIPAASSQEIFSSTNRLTIAIIGFENRTGSPTDECWRVALARLMNGSLSEVKSLHSKPGVEYALAQLHKKAGDAIDQGAARRIGESIEARRVIWGDYRRRGTNWLVTVRLMNVATGKVREFSARASDWFVVRDALLSPILAQLGIQPTPVEQKKMQQRLTCSPATLEWLAKATLLHDNNRPYPETEPCARQALAADTNCAKAYMLLGAVLASQGKFEEADKAMRTGTALKPDDAYGHKALAHLLGVRHQYREAGDELLEAERLDPDDAEIFQLQGEIDRMQEQNFLALAAFRKAARLDPFDAVIQADVGWTYAILGDRDKAMQALRLAEQLALKDDQDAEQMLASAYNALHEVLPAIDHYAKLVSLGRKQGANPQMMDAFEKTLGELKSRLQPVYLTASMPQEYAASELTNALKARLTKDEFLLVTNPLACTAAMEHWARELTAGATNDLQKARMLFDKLIRHLDPEHDHASRTAAEVFEKWDKPGQSFVCKDYANLYVALARAVGLKTFWVYVSEEVDGLHGAHACAGVYLGGKLLLVDPAYIWFGVPHKQFKVLDDVQTIGAYIGQNASSPAMARLACKLAPDFDLAQGNLFYRLMSNSDWSEAAVVMTNVLSLEPASALAWAVRGEWAVHEEKNDLALECLQKSVELDPTQGGIFAEIAFLYGQQRKHQEARENLRKALRCGLNEEDAKSARETIAGINEAIGSD